MAKKVSSKEPQDKLLPRITVGFFDRPRLTAFIWVALTIFGMLSYTTFLKREGFPTVNVPFAFINGVYAVNDPVKVDKDVARVISDAALKQDGVSAVQSQSADNFVIVSVQYKEGTNAEEATKKLEESVKQSGSLPKTAQVQFNVPKFGVAGPDKDKIDMTLSFYGDDSVTSTKSLVEKANLAVAKLNEKNVEGVDKFFLRDPFEKAVNPQTGQAIKVQKSFDQYGIRQNDDSKFYNSVIIGVTGDAGVDVLKLDKNVRAAVEEVQKEDALQAFNMEVSASYAPSINDNISELQKVLLEGLLAVLVVGSIVIAIRAAVITVISMITVLLITLGFLFLIGYSLNVITLFALILGLALIVDDTIIMVEAIDAARRKTTSARVAVKSAIKKVSRAMVAATLTAALSFAPILFVGGVLGSFIRAIPITIIASLLISLVVALLFIPLFSRFLLLGKKHMGKNAEKEEVAAGIEAKIAQIVAKPMLWARGSQKKLFAVGSSAVLIGFAFIFGGIFIARSVVFNIFPPTKDTNGLGVSMNFAPDTTLEKAQLIAAKADKIVASELGENFVQGSYYNTGTANSAMLQTELISYNKRDIKAPELIEKLQARLDSEFKDAKFNVAQTDVGPPSAPFVIQINAENRQAAYKLAGDLEVYLKTAELKRPDGSIAKIKNVNISSQNQYIRNEGKPIVTVTAGFDGDDTTTLVTLGQSAVDDEFNADKLKSYGLSEGAVAYDLGQESENQDSFKTLALAFPIMLVVIYLVLLIEFRSFLQPLLIFMAIPFSIFGVMFGLYITDNAISFFSMLGFFALVGLSIKNTILLTDFANQARRNGSRVIDSAVEAIEERFRPLVATSLTAVVALIPLALTSPFWEGLAVVLIFGLLSSTLLVITVFPYYYLGTEYLRLKITAKSFFAWLVPTLVVAILAGKFLGFVYALLIVLISLVLTFFDNKRESKSS